MPYLALCDDDPTVDAARLRSEAKQAHFAYIESILDLLLVAGPLPQPGGEGYAASLFIYDTEQEEEARRLLENDPYYAAGLYGRVRLAAFTPAAGQWFGGTVW